MSDCSSEGLIFSGDRRIIEPRTDPFAVLAIIFTFEFNDGMYESVDEFLRGDNGVAEGAPVDEILNTPLILIRLKPQDEP